MIMVTVFKIGAMIGTDIDVVNIVDGIIPTLLDFPLLGCAILALCLPSHHHYWNISVKTDGVTTGTGVSEGSETRILSPRCLALSEVISHHQGEASDVSFSSFLDDLSKVLDSLK